MSAELSLYEQASSAAKFIREQNPFARLPKVAAVLGSGFKGFVDVLDIKHRVPFAEIPFFITPTVAGHGGDLIYAHDQASDRDILVMSGRIHLYEGHSPSTIVHPVRSLGLAGISHIILTNAAGGLTMDLSPGSVVTITDQINFTGQNCLSGNGASAFGKQFVDMLNAYDDAWTMQLRSVRSDLKRGIYAGCLGPTYETAAETRWIASTGANVVGMSTVHECIAARQLGIKVLGLSLVTNLAAGLSTKVDHEEVLQQALAAKQELAKILSAAISTIV